MLNGDPVIKEVRSITTLFQMGNTLPKIELMLLCKHAFQMFPKTFFPFTRLHGMPSQALHFTHIPSHQGMDVIAIRTSKQCYHLHITKVVALLQEQLAAMHINLNIEVITLISAMIHPTYQKKRDLHL